MHSGQFLENINPHDVDMKLLWCCWLLIIPITLPAQKYALLDQNMVQPIRFTNRITMLHQHQKKFPVEVKHLRGFYKILLIIRKKLANAEASPADHYALGCVSITGRPVSLIERSTRDYVAIFNCDSVKFYLHLSSASFENETNLFVINSWIRYLKRNVMK